MISKRVVDAIYKAKLMGMSDEAISQRFSVTLRDIERVVVAKTGTNLNLFSPKHTLRDLSPKEFRLETTTVWSFKSRGRWATHTGNYRGNWSPYIPRNIILRYSQPGDLVLDQFCGGGTTAVEAKLLGRKCISRDINPAAVSLTCENLDFSVASQKQFDNQFNKMQFYEPTVQIGDARFLDGIHDNTIDLICTHPPYANIINYTDGNPRDISFHDIDTFIEDMVLVAQECYRVLKPGCVCAILIGDTRKRKHVVPMGFRTIQAFQNEGFEILSLVIKRQHNCKTTGFWYSSSIKHGFLLLSHEYLPIFRKPVSKLPIRIERENRSPLLRVQQMSQLLTPPIIECKTTWVCDHDKFDDTVDANVINRYGGNGTILKLNLQDGELFDSIQGKKEYSLVYISAYYDDSSSVDHTKCIDHLVAKIGLLIRDEGHLVLRTKDVRYEKVTDIPVLTIWRIPERCFVLKEIVILTTKPSNDGSVPIHQLEINHEYMLVYQKNGK